jgi:hypothetical protein
MKDLLSPAAQAVLDAFLDTPGEVPMPMWDYGRDLAAALRAAADQVVPDKCPPIEDFNEFDQGYAAAHSTNRQALLAIAAELRGTTNTSGKD